ncbi:uncharacterized protein LOC129762510 [Toxorhynchites rutilus septentrionalis]|uniref:uncharacterized protein LOC129762510 n=1 Tax=Toxorhynchites rutilus septentrionalis TaxID=329112 RepID=UPI00247B2221|nr:uncharacterized protein LOC129762510 [Toxorhynchites rutilus septentrionalis]
MKFPFFAKVSDQETFKLDILLHCLNSKRLLVDHVEILEDCLQSLGSRDESSQCTGRTLMLASCISAAIILSPIRSVPRWAYATCTGIGLIGGTVCGFKLVNRIHLKRKEKSLQHLIKSLEQFEVVVKKNLLLVNESLHVRSMQKGDAEDVVGNCIRCCVETIKKIHTSVRMLENEFPLSENLNALYLPMEALEDCELLSEEMVAKAIGPKAIKEFYNIFAYMQSQYLTRFALSVACGHQVLPDRLLELSNEIDQQRHKCMSFLNRIAFSNQNKAVRVTPKTLPPEISNLRTLSITLSVKLLSIVQQYNKLEDRLEQAVQNCDGNELPTHLKSFEEPLECIAGGLTASEEECQRLLISLKRILNEDPTGSAIINPQFVHNADSTQADQTAAEVRCYSEQDVPTIRDEFFAVDGTEQHSDEESRRRSVGSIDDIDNINSKIVKRHFKPVLKQLRERIEPIGVEFKAREKRALMDKGIEWDDKEQDECGKWCSYGSESENDDDPDRNLRKLQKSVQRYDEVRGFLAAKKQMNIFGLKPMECVVNEDVLE